MKSGIITVIIAGIVVVTGVTYSFIRANGKPVDEAVAMTAKPKVLSNVVHVDELAQKPENFQGEFTLSGVVAGVRKTDGVFAVIDSREFKLCGVLTCAANIIPVKFAGPMPDLKNIVEITGRVVRDERGLLIEAKRVEVVK